MSSDKASQSVEQARELVERAAQAQKTLATFSQEKVDEIVGAMARAALADAYRLGEMAHLETGFGVAADKATKNRFSAEQVYNFIKPMRTVGILKQTGSLGNLIRLNDVFDTLVAVQDPASPGLAGVVSPER